MLKYWRVGILRYWGQQENGLEFYSGCYPVVDIKGTNLRIVENKCSVCLKRLDGDNVHGCRQVRILDVALYRISTDCGGCNRSRSRVESRRVIWSPPLPGVLEFNVDGVARGKIGPLGIGGVLHNMEGLTFIFFSELVGIRV